MAVIVSLSSVESSYPRLLYLSRSYKRVIEITTGEIYFATSRSASIRNGIRIYLWSSPGGAATWFEWWLFQLQRVLEGKRTITDGFCASKVASVVIVFKETRLARSLCRSMFFGVYPPSTCPCSEDQSVPFKMLLYACSSLARSV